MATPPLFQSGGIIKQNKWYYSNRSRFLQRFLLCSNMEQFLTCCNKCLEGKPCDTWTLPTTTQKDMLSHQVCKSMVNGVSDSDNCNGTGQKLASSDHEIGNFVAAVYDGMWYLGRI